MKKRKPVTPITLTYSSLSTFLTCRRKYYNRIVRKLVPKSRSAALFFGGCIHDCLDSLYSYDRGHGSDLYAQIIRKHFCEPGTALMSDHNHNKENICKAMAMVGAYEGFYIPADFERYEFVAVEQLLEGRIRALQKSGVSRKKTRHLMTFAGKIDGLVIDKTNNCYYLIEHKTAGVVNSTYLERIQGDLQIILYVVYVEMILGITISGVLYNVLEKCKLRMGQGETEGEFEGRLADAIEKAKGKDNYQRRTGETEGEFEIRLAELLTKSKTGKSSAKRKMPEDMEDLAVRQSAILEKVRDNTTRKMPESVTNFLARCVKWHGAGMQNGAPEHYYREMVVFSEDEKQSAIGELWNLSAHVRDAFNGDHDSTFYKNRTACNNFGLCSYWPLCNGSDDDMSIELMFDIKEPFQELKENNGRLVDLKKGLKRAESRRVDSETSEAEVKTKLVTWDEKSDTKNDDDLPF